MKNIINAIDLYAEDCITNYLKRHQMKIKHSYIVDQYGRIGDLFLLFDSKKIGHLHYSFDKSLKDLHIDKIIINESYKKYVPLKISKLLLLYTLSFYTRRILSASLTSISSVDPSKVGEEYCLSCFYETLGFEPFMNDDIKRELDECVIQLKKKKQYEDIKNTCLLCKCQRNKIQFSTRNLTYLQVDMKALLPNLAKSLQSIMNIIS